MIKKYLRDSLAELNNVTWPTRKQGIRITTIVFIFMIVAAVVLGFLDQLFAWAIRALLSL
ncbi:preprotein translocase subunit SecE [Patescibacteria group bacterium]|nr:preprotein translocase subunit SecE [Patescibacteria group bacterium]MBU1015861.1 preprotein translocase subunit SecE [Patescibacteria group bacterium]MBU1685390.1 preprotein translocase subunit SecE [Patescibacteria group bacterium]MBU1938451.1 preprotein translocase subunit SecE [Patescibacteria group bacterium]